MGSCRYHSERSLQATADYAVIADKHGMTPTQLALGWAYGRFYMGAVIIGATTLEQVSSPCLSPHGDARQLTNTLAPSTMCVAPARC